jgi:dTMP kinase
MAPGKFITFEGGEGSGKSTQARLLAERLRGRGTEAVLTREPGGSPFAERLRKILLDPATEPHSPLAETLLFYAARADHLDAVIRPALTLGGWVICDRFSDSTRVYQGQAGVLREQVFDALELVVVAPTRPDLTFIIDVPAEIGLARAMVREGSKDDRSGRPGVDQGENRIARGLLSDRYESRDLSFHRRLREGFLKIAAAEPVRCVVIDGQQSPDEVAQSVWQAVTERMIAGAV